MTKQTTPREQDPQTDTFREGYRAGQIDRQTNSNNGLSIGLILGVIFTAGLLGIGAWALLGNESQSGPDVINIPAPEKPDSPDINIDLPKPELKTPDVKIDLPDVNLPTSEDSGEAQSSDQ